MRISPNRDGERAALEAVAFARLGHRLQIESVRRTPVAYRLVNETTASLQTLLICGHDDSGAAATVRTFAKTLRRDAPDPTPERERFRPSNEPAHWNYWRREYEAYGSGLLETLPAGMRAPLWYHRTLEDGIATLYLEMIEGEPARAWEPAVFERTAALLGHWQGLGLADPAGVSREPWLCRSFLRAWAFGEAHTLARSVEPALWESDLAREHFEPEHRRAAVRLAQSHAALLAEAECAPLVVSHNDLWSTNLISTPSSIVVLDWSMLGLSGIAEDVANLAFDSVWMFDVDVGRFEMIERAIRRGYACGLSTGGAVIDDATIERAFSRTAALRFATLAALLLRAALDPEKQRLLAARYERSFAEIFAVRAAVVRRALEITPAVAL